VTLKPTSIKQHQLSAFWDESWGIVVSGRRTMAKAVNYVFTRNYVTRNYA
jgi:hypothetical protein